MCRITNPGGRNRAWAALAVALLLLVTPIFSACSPQSMAQAEGTTATALASPSVASTSSPTIVATPSPVTTTVVGTVLATDTETVEGTPTVRPIPTGTPPAPLDTLNVLAAVPGGAMLVKRDNLQLDPGGSSAGPEEVLFTITSARQAITEETTSAIGVLGYDPLYREWKGIWASELVSGTASPLLGIGQIGIGGYNGGNLVGKDAPPVLALRTTLSNGRARLYLWQWNAKDKAAHPLKMTRQGAAPANAVFEADLDVNMVDLDGDGVYEVLLDNLTGTQLWKWNENSYVPRQEGR